jgi:LacI family transcriptional regulator
MGRLAVELLLRSIRGEELDEQRHEIDTQLVERASTTPRLRPAEPMCPTPFSALPAIPVAPNPAART